MSPARAFEALCGRGLDDRALRIGLLAELRRDVPFDFHAWLLTDPQTTVGWSPLADTPSLAELPMLIRAKYLTTVNRWTELEPSRSASLVDAVDGDLSQSMAWRDAMADHGVTDVLSVVLADRFGCWGFLDLWRCGGEFDARDRSVVDEMAEVVTPALRATLAGTLTDSGNGGQVELPDEPVVVLLSDALRLLHQTAASDAYLRALLPTDAERPPVPAAVFNVAAQLLAVEAGVDDHPPQARVRLDDTRWATLRAARLEGDETARGLIAVGLTATPPDERADLLARLVGLTERESALLQALLGGADTRELADQLHMSPHTVQDHLKAVFTKTGVRTRRALVARVMGR